MKRNKELILLIPGISKKKKGDYLDMLVAGIENYCRGNSIRLTGIKDSDEKGGTRKIEFTPAHGDSRQLFFRELSWCDLQPNLSEEKAHVKLIRGFDLLCYWTFCRDTWREVSSSKYLIINTTLTLLILCMWYIGIVSLGFSAFSEYLLGTAHAQSSVVALLSDSSKKLAEYPLWLPSTLLMVIFPINSMVNTIHTAKCYIQNRNGLFHKVCGRVRNEIMTVLDTSDEYDRITVLSHSFGVVVGVEVLADLQPAKGAGIRTITMGGPLKLIAGKSNRIRRALAKIADNDLIGEWFDFYSDRDWLCSSTPLKLAHEKYRSQHISTSVPYDERFTGKSHTLYFRDWDVIKKLLEEKA